MTTEVLLNPNLSGGLLGYDLIQRSTTWKSLSATASLNIERAVAGSIPVGTVAVSYRLAFFSFVASGRTFVPSGTVYETTFVPQDLAVLQPAGFVNLLGTSRPGNLQAGEIVRDSEGRNVALALTPTPDGGPGRVYVANPSASSYSNFLSTLWLTLPNHVEDQGPTWGVELYATFDVGVATPDTERACRYGEPPAGATQIQIYRSRDYEYNYVNPPRPSLDGHPKYTLDRNDFPRITWIGAFRWLDADDGQVGEVIRPRQSLPTSVCDPLGDDDTVPRTGTGEACEFGEVPEGAEYLQALSRSACDLSDPYAVFDRLTLGSSQTYILGHLSVLPDPIDVGIFRWLDVDGNQIGEIQDYCFAGVPVPTCEGSRLCEYGIEAPEGAAYVTILQGCDRDPVFFFQESTINWIDSSATYRVDSMDLPKPRPGFIRFLDADGSPIGDELGHDGTTRVGTIIDGCPLWPESICPVEPVVPPPEPPPGTEPPPPGPEVERYLLGVPYDHFIETLDLARTGAGDTMGRRQSIARVRVHLLETSALRIGPREGKVQDVPFRQFEPIGASVEPLSGYRRIPIPREWNSNGRMRIEGVDGLRMEVLSLMPDAQIGDE